MTTRLTMNLLLNIAENAEVGSKISFTTRLVKNLSLSVGIAENAKINGSISNRNNKTVKILTFFKNLSRL